MKRAIGGKVVGSIKCAAWGEVVSGSRGSSEETEFICERADPYSEGKKWWWWLNRVIFKLATKATVLKIKTQCKR